MEIFPTHALTVPSAEGGGTDFSFPDGSVMVLRSGLTNFEQTCQTVQIVGDSILEDSEEFSLTLGAESIPAGVTRTSTPVRDRTTYTIADNTGVSVFI